MLNRQLDPRLEMLVSTLWVKAILQELRHLSRQNSNKHRKSSISKVSQTITIHLQMMQLQPSFKKLYLILKGMKKDIQKAVIEIFHLIRVLLMEQLVLLQNSLKGTGTIITIWHQLTWETITKFSMKEEVCTIEQKTQVSKANLKWMIAMNFLKISSKTNRMSLFSIKSMNRATKKINPIKWETLAVYRTTTKEQS